MKWFNIFIESEALLEMIQCGSVALRPNIMEVIQKYSLQAIFLCVLIQNIKTASRIDPLVETNIGLVRGLKSTDGSYAMFLGIPYATVEEANPFGASTPHPGFDEVFEAYDDSAICPQVEEFNKTVVGSLDCLHLNIYVPSSASSRNRLPVLVWIYGGGFSIGFSGRYVYGPSFLVRHDIILVTLNYRVGPYGFMCLDIPEVPGNQGLKDQQQALKWIKSHIESFGGDTNKITIFGESAGGASVDLHLFYNRENLFNKVILQSGSAMGAWALAESDPSLPLEIARYLGFSSDNVEEALSFLSSADTKLVIAASSELDITYRPCVEKVFDGVESFMTKYPINTEIPRVGNVPILIGHNSDERLTDILEPPQDKFHEYLLNHFDFAADQLAEMEKVVKHFYIGDDDVNEQSVWSVANFDSDFTFTYPTQRSIKKYIENGADIIYQYMFSYNGGRNFVKSRLNMTVGGAVHADEVGYLFDISFMKDEPSPEDQLVIDRITTLWANFVKYGNPTPETSELLPVGWMTVTEDISYYLNINSELSLKRRPFHERMAFWDLFYKLNKKVEIGYLDNE